MVRSAKSVRRSSGSDCAKTEGPTVVCGIDDAFAERTVLAFVAELVGRIGGRLVLTHVLPPPLLPLQPQIAYAAPGADPNRDLRTVAQQLARVAHKAGIAPTTKVHVGFGDLEDRVIATARREEAALVVVGSHEASTLGRRGIVPSRLIEHAGCPVVVVPAPGGPRTGAAAAFWGQEPIAAASTGGDAVAMTSSKGVDVTRSSIVCGIDGSRDARVALRLAAQLSSQLGVQLVVAHVVQPPVPSPGLGPTARQLAEVPLDALLAAGEALVEKILDEEQLRDAKRRVVFGFPADRLADVADDEAAELIVVGSRGRGSFKAALLGSVSNDVIGVARCPVLVVPPAAAAGLREREQTPTALGTSDLIWAESSRQPPSGSSRGRDGVRGRTTAGLRTGSFEG